MHKYLSERLSMGMILVMFLLLSSSLVFIFYLTINIEEEVETSILEVYLDQEYNIEGGCPFVIYERGIDFQYKGGKKMNLDRPIREGSLYIGDKCTLYKEDGELKIKIKGEKPKNYELRIVK
ncbi:MAG: hypothetical protein GY828_07935 [Candidatus Gracilibacteria bacterium]|nr:hypothetical protein [Candidatus Gracilibacteria bacterium]